MDRSFSSLLVWSAAILGAIGLLLYLFVFDVTTVSGDDPLLVASMVPTLAPGDRVLVRRESSPRVGQLARCASPDAKTPFVFARVMGTEGDRVEIKEGRVTINGQALPSRHGCPPVEVAHPITGRAVTLACHVEDNGSWTYSYLSPMALAEGPRSAVVEPGKVFLVSDNRHIHKDSRDYGQLDASTCEHVVFRLWGERFADSSRRFTILY